MKDTSGFPVYKNIAGAQKAWLAGDKKKAIKIIADIKFKEGAKISKADHKVFVVASDFNSGIGDRFWGSMGWDKVSSNEKAEALFISHFLSDPQ